MKKLQLKLEQKALKKKLEVFVKKELIMKQIEEKQNKRIIL